MKFAIISDLHANLDALETVLDHAGDLPILCLGDLVGYGAQPNEVIDIVRSRAIHTIMGNHDLACADGTGAEDFNPRARESVIWTNRQLTQTNIDWLLSLPYTITQPTFTLVHGSPDRPEMFWYVCDRWDAKCAFDASPDELTFVGHSHIPGIFELRPDGITVTQIAGDREISLIGLDHGARYIVNVGSIGQPRDKDPRASYVVYDDAERTVTWHRIKYNIKAAQKKIRATSLPPTLADRLARGE